MNTDKKSLVNMGAIALLVLAAAVVYYFATRLFDPWVSPLKWIATAITIVGVVMAFRKGQWPFWATISSLIAVGLWIYGFAKGFINLLVGVSSAAALFLLVVSFILYVSGEKKASAT